MVEVVDGIGVHPFPAASYVVCGSSAGGHCGVERSAEICDGAGGSSDSGQFSAHSVCGIDAQVSNGETYPLVVTPGPVPPQRRLGGCEPELEGLGGDGADVGGHLPPFRTVGDEFSGDELDHAERGGQHHLVEVLAPAQHAGLDVIAGAEV